MQSNNLDKESARLLSEAISNKPGLKTLLLDLYDNRIGPEGIKHISKGIAVINLAKLSLYLYNNEISLEGARCLAQAIGQSNSVTHLHLDLPKNSLLPEGVRVLGKSVLRLNRLSSLHLDLQDLFYHGSNDIQSDLSSRLKRLP